MVEQWPHKPSDVGSIPAARTISHPTLTKEFMTTINDTLAQRGQRYGVFADHSEHSQAIKLLFKKLMGAEKWASLAADQREALEMIAHKLSRITNGDPHYADSWHDIAGYAELVSNRLSLADGEKKNDVPDDKEDVFAPCDCPACTLQKFMEGELGSDTKATAKDTPTPRMPPAEAAMAAMLLMALEAANK